MTNFMVFIECVRFSKKKKKRISQNYSELYYEKFWKKKIGPAPETIFGRLL